MARVAAEECTQARRRSALRRGGGVHSGEAECNHEHYGFGMAQTQTQAPGPGGMQGRACMAHTAQSGLNVHTRRLPEFVTCSASLFFRLLASPWSRVQT